MAFCPRNAPCPCQSNPREFIVFLVAECRYVSIAKQFHPGTPRSSHAQVTMHASDSSLYRRTIAVHSTCLNAKRYCLRYRYNRLLTRRIRRRCRSRHYGDCIGDCFYPAAAVHCLPHGIRTPCGYGPRDWRRDRRLSDTSGRSNCFGNCHSSDC